MSAKKAAPPKQPASVSKTQGIGKGTPGPGRPKGLANKNTRKIKDMILGALHAAGGEDYLRRQATKNSSAFLALLGRVVPQELKADIHAAATITVERAYGEQPKVIESHAERLDDKTPGV